MHNGAYVQLCISTIVISFLEGRRNTELLGAGLCVSFITASGITKAVGRFLIIHFHVSDFWMPFCTGLVFVPVLLLGVWMLSLIPPQSEEDKASRSERTPMGASERMKFFRSFSWGVILSTLTYATLTVYRDLRDNFAVELWAQMGYGGNAGILATSEIIIAVMVLSIVASMIKVTDHKRVFFGNIYTFIGSGCLLFVMTWLFAHEMVSPALWMISTGFGLYLCYACFHTMFFERWIALFRYKSNISFLICVADSFGYLGSVGVLLYKNFYTRDMDWLHFIVTAAYISGILIAGLSVMMAVYFRYVGKPKKEIQSCFRTAM